MLESLIGKRLRPSEFALLAFGWKPYDYQVGPLDCESSYILLDFGRQSGKTEIAAIAGLYHALWHDGATVLVISKTQRQSGIIFRRMKEFLNFSAAFKRELAIDGMITRETQLAVEFSNGSAIYSLPATEDGGNLRGFTAHMIIVDEAAEVKDEVYPTITPMLATTSGMLVLVGTPKGCHNFFYRAWSDPSFGFTCFYYDSSNGVNYTNPRTGNPMVTEEFLQRERLKMGDMLFDQEYRARFLEEADCFFPVELVDRCTDKDCPQRDEPLQGYAYFLGVDPAREGKDETVLCVLERRGDGVLYAVKFLALKKKNIAEIAQLVAHMHEQWEFQAIVADETGVGAGLVDILHAVNFPVTGVRFTQKSKEQTFSNCKTLMVQGKVVLPSLPQLRRQLLDMKFEPMETYIKIYVSSERLYHDDYVAALVLACWAIRERPGLVYGGGARGLFRR